MTQEIREKVRDMLSIAYQLGYTHKSAGNMAYLEIGEVLNALMDSIILAEKTEKTEIPEPDHIAEVPADSEDGIVWREGAGCLGCICSYCVHGGCGEDCEFGEAFDCKNVHTDEVIKECKYYEEME